MLERQDSPFQNLGRLSKLEYLYVSENLRVLDSGAGYPEFGKLSNLELGSNLS